MMATLQPASQQVLWNIYQVPGTEFRARITEVTSTFALQELPVQKGVRIVSGRLQHVGICAGYRWDRRRWGHMDSVSIHVEPETGGGWRERCPIPGPASCGLVTPHCPHTSKKKSRTEMRNDSRRRKHQSPIHNRW